jgi:hypothetical protein
MLLDQCSRHCLANRGKRLDGLEEEARRGESRTVPSRNGDFECVPKGKQDFKMGMLCCG